MYKIGHENQKLFTFPRVSNRPQVEDQNIQFLAKAIIHGNYSKTGQIKVYMSKKLFYRLYPSGDPSKIYYVNIGPYVYQIGINNNLSQRQISINQVQKCDLRPFFSPMDLQVKLWIGQFNPDRCEYSNLEHVRIGVDLLSYNFDEEYEDPIEIDVNDLKATVFNKYKGQFFERKQKLLIPHKDGNIIAIIDERTLCSDPFDKILTQGLEKVPGRLTDDTRVEFYSKNHLIDLIEIHDSSSISTIHFSIVEMKNISNRIVNDESKVPSFHSAWKYGNSPFPLTISMTQLSKLIRESFENNCVQLGREQKIKLTNDWAIKVKFDRLIHKESSKVSSSEDTQYNQLYELSALHNVRIDSGDFCVITTDPDKAIRADRIKLVIIDCYFSNSLEKNGRFWVSAEELLAAIRKVYEPVGCGSRFTVKLKHSMFLIELDHAVGDAQSLESIRNNINDVWAIDDQSEIKIRSDDDLNLDVVDASVEHILKEVVFKVVKGAKNIDDLSCAQCNKKKKEREDRVIMSKDELTDLLSDSLPHVILPKHQMLAKSDKGEIICFSLASYDYPGKAGKLNKYGELLKISQDTTIQFDTDKAGNVVVATPPEFIEYANIQEKLKSLGVGGMKKKCINYLRDIILSRGKYKSYFKDLGIKPSRGAIFYGPAGTGKTSLARNLGEILGAVGHRFIQVSSTEVLNKWGGGSEKNLRNIFEGARRDYEEFGDDAPIWVVLFDEIEAITKKRTAESRRHEISLVDTFISELDGIAGESGKSLNNIVVVGSTNNIDIIDPAVLRSGRLDVHIEFGIPNAIKRREIFDIHTKSLQEKNLIEGDVDSRLKCLVGRTIGKTGAFIEDVVGNAARLSVRRLDDHQVGPEQRLNHPLAKLTLEDFMKGYKMSLKANDKVGQGLAIDVPQEVKCTDIPGQLKDLGIVGLSSNVLDVLNDLMLTQVAYHDQLVNLSYEFPKGILLYGPKGTGKTSLLKVLPQLFGLDGDRFQYYTSSNLWQKSNEDLREELSELFRPAFQAAKDLGSESPPYFVVIENIEMLYRHSKSGDKDQLPQISDFLVELDAIYADKFATKKQKGKRVNNLIVIATTTTNRELHPDIIKYGTLGVSVEMKLPDVKMRKEIFEMYLNPYVQKKMVMYPIRYNTLADHTKDKSGEFIKAVDTKAMTYPLKRAMETGVSKEELHNFTRCKLSMKDLERAIVELDRTTPLPYIV